MAFTPVVKIYTGLFGLPVSYLSFLRAPMASVVLNIAANEAPNLTIFSTPYGRSMGRPIPGRFSLPAWATRPSAETFTQSPPESGQCNVLSFDYHYSPLTCVSRFRPLIYILMVHGVATTLHIQWYVHLAVITILLIHLVISLPLILKVLLVHHVNSLLPIYMVSVARFELAVFWSIWELQL